MSTTAHPSGPPTSDVEELDKEQERRRRIERNQPTIALLQSWLEDDTESEEEQRAALEWLMRVLDEDRPSYRKLFS